MSERGLFLDLDGTLADSLGAMRRVYDAFLGSHGATGSDAEFARLNGPPLPALVAQLKERCALATPHAELLRRYEAMIEEAYAEVAPAAEAEALLRAAAAVGWRTAIVTSSSAARTRRWLERTGLAPLVGAVVGGDEVSRGKPAPDPYLAALERTGCLAARSLAVEDSPQGAAAALAAGIPTLLLEAGGRPIGERPAGVTAIAGLGAVVPLLTAAPRG